MARVDRDVRLVASVAAWLRAQGYQNEPFRIMIRCASLGLRVELEEGSDWGEDAAAGQQAAPPPPGKWLSPTGQRIYDFLFGRGLSYTPGEAIAQFLGRPHDQRFRALLTELVDRDVLDVLSGSGYRVMPPNGPNEPAPHRPAGVRDTSRADDDA